MTADHSPRPRPDAAPLTRDAFRRLHPISEPRPLPVPPERVWTDTEWDRIRRGYHAWSMDEKWNVFAEGHTLFLHRSTTGRGMYEATFAPVPEGGLRIASALVEGDPKRYRSMGDAYDRLMLELVVSAIVLGEPATELRAQLKELSRPGAAAAFEHSALGLRSKT
ncbi:hypothetical protein [Streptomyces cavernicola]|uniref:Uncharacterized protein n=1 Tax=Streptomyces cavernicola TaxID=3043613 RepID=A0ABT6SAI4_9ACTN|nr:hypothetical protein [Streptomyces sp. B-S-A6]MDI3405201.1 hypothetical protein [Streptomyces sp. B-S-A6]